MTPDRHEIRDERGEVLDIDAIGGGAAGPMLELRVRLPHLAAHVKPGQFAQLRVADQTTPLLRRPFSVAWTDNDICHFVFAAVGVGTRALAALRPGAAIDALGPLGTGFSLDAAQSAPAVLVSGGLGCAPFPLLARDLRRRDRAVVILSGAATAQRLYPVERFQRGDTSVRVVEATDDGSRGHHGYVTDLLADYVGADATVHACGPNPMLAALHGKLRDLDITTARAEASLEAPMGCGFGTCLGCALPVHGVDGVVQWALCCSDGPVLPLDRVAWNELLLLPGADVA